MVFKTDCGKGFGEEYQEWVRVEYIDLEGAQGCLLGCGTVSMSWFGGWLHKHIHIQNVNKMVM